jgi:hypothetical protein
MSGEGYWLEQDSEEYSRIHFQLLLSTVHLGTIDVLSIYKIICPSIQEQFEGYNEESYPKISSWYSASDFSQLDMGQICSVGFSLDNSLLKAGYKFSTGNIRFDEGADVYSNEHCFFFVDVATGRSYLKEENNNNQPEEDLKIPSGFNSLYLVPGEGSLTFAADGKLDMEKYSEVAHFSNRHSR